MISFHKATHSYAQTLSDLAKAIYQENYLHLWLPGGADWYMNQYAYSLHQIEQELADSNNVYYLLLDNQEPVGYLKLVLNSTFTDYDPADALEIERIYLLENRKGRGLGKKMMQLAMDTALELNKKAIFLKAMDSSQEAIAFYQNQGYSICETFSLPMPTFALMKESYRGMLVLMQLIPVDSKA
ncbi:MAG: hypothetical protein RLY89_36 [Bacteroidota bacterium]|jgi:ribosomal protein S18 acetylase RimI-like enzyme